MSAFFKLVVVATQDGYIARHSGHSPAEWASPEEQSLFLSSVDSADWSVLGRGTHNAARRVDRRRIVFSKSAASPEWRAPNQLWLDPAHLRPDDLPDLVASVHPLKQAVILGGTAVHDWFLRHRRIDRVDLTIEPVRFGSGLPIFSDVAGAPEEVLRAAGFDLDETCDLNGRGTRLQAWHPAS